MWILVQWQEEGLPHNVISAERIKIHRKEVWHYKAGDLVQARCTGWGWTVARQNHQCIR